MNKIYDKIRNKAILDSEIIREMEDLVFDINFECDRDNWPLLMCVVRWGRKELVEYLLLIPDINVYSWNDTALHVCKDVSILRLLLNRKDLDVNILSGFEQTGLHCACWWRLKTCAKEYLLDARVDIRVIDWHGNTARGIALREKCPDIAKIINNSRYTTLLRIPNEALCRDIVRMIIEEYV